MNPLARTKRETKSVFWTLLRGKPWTWRGRWIWKSDTRKLYAFIERALSPRERKVIILRYGLGGAREMTQREIASALGISRSYVSRIEKSALKKLRAGFPDSGEE